MHQVSQLCRLLMPGDCVPNRAAGRLELPRRRPAVRAADELGRPGGHISAALRAAPAADRARHRR